MENEYISTDMCLTTEDGVRWLLANGVIVQREQELWKDYGRYAVRKGPASTIFQSRYAEIVEFVIANTRSKLEKGTPYKISWLWDLIVRGQTIITDGKNNVHLRYKFDMAPRNDNNKKQVENYF